MQKRFGISWYVVVAAAVLLGGCGDGATAGGSGGSPAKPPQQAKELDPCTLPTAQELAAVLGGPALEPRKRGGVSADNCWWDNEAKDKEAAVQLLAVVGGADSGKYGYGWRREYFDKIWGTDAKAVNGIADSAWFHKSSRSGTLYVLKGSLGYSVGLTFDSAKDRPTDEALLSVLRPFAEGIAARY